MTAFKERLKLASSTHASTCINNNGIIGLIMRVIQGHDITNNELDPNIK